MLEFLLVVVFFGCGVPLVVHEEWLERGHPRLALGWLMAAVAVFAALGLMVLL